MKKNRILTSLDQFIDNNIGTKGSKNRKKFESDYEAFKSNAPIKKVKKKLRPTP